MSLEDKMQKPVHRSKRSEICPGEAFSLVFVMIKNARDGAIHGALAI